jgi:vancomycin resistance protein YoaR
MAAVFIASGLGITYLLLPPAPEPPPAPRGTPALKVGGVVVPAQGDLIANTLDLVRRYAAGDLVLKLPNGASRPLKRSLLGAEIDRARLAKFVEEAKDPSSPLRRAHDRKAPDAPLDVPVPITIDADIALARLLDLKTELDTAATDAYVDLTERKLKPEKLGQRLDVYGTLARIDEALHRGDGEVAAQVEIVAPKMLAAQLGNVKFDHVLGYFETRYSQGEKARARTYNLRQAASKLDGTVVLPGQTFDFNGTVGPRDEAHGYKIAPVIAEGELVDGLGGGTCQISGTLHGAVFFAGLDIVERYPHSRPSFYIKLGLDATVVYPTINFRFKNPFDFPIVLHETVANGVVRAEVLGPERKLTVTYFRRIDEVIPFDEVERKTPKLPEGTRILAQRGIPGFRMASSRVVRDGAYAVREKWSDAYPPTMQIIHVGTGPTDEKSKAQDDQHPEYVVDEYLTVTQGPDIHTPGVGDKEAGGGTVESREPGKTGEAGWIEKNGLSKFKAKEGERDETIAEGQKPTKSPVAESSDGKSKEDGAKGKRKRKKKKDKDAKE